MIELMLTDDGAHSTEPQFDRGTITVNPFNRDTAMARDVPFDDSVDGETALTAV
jgi:hypothetical protein